MSQPGHRDRDSWGVSGVKGPLPGRPRDLVPTDVRPGQAGFLEDAQRALHVWRTRPALPAMTTALAIVAAVASSDLTGNVLAGLVGLALLGWVGSERLWYLRAYTGASLSVLTALRAAFAYWGRFFALFFLTCLISLPLSLPAVFALYRAGRDASDNGQVDVPLWSTLYLLAVSLLIDFLLTFVTPALVFTSRRARDAVSIGLTLLRRTWRHSAAYVLFPPLAVLILTRFSTGPVGWGGAALIVVSSLFNLLAKGATAAYYLRVMPPVGPAGDLDLDLA